MFSAKVKMCFVDLKKNDKKSEKKAKYLKTHKSLKSQHAI